MLIIFAAASNERTPPFCYNGTPHDIAINYEVDIWGYIGVSNSENYKQPGQELTLAHRLCLTITSGQAQRIEVNPQASVVS